jgi:hypothetical protein
VIQGTMNTERILEARTMGRANASLGGEADSHK